MNSTKPEIEVNIIKRGQPDVICPWCDITGKTKNHQTQSNTEQASGNYQFIQEMEEHIKQHHRDAISQVQNVENSIEQVTQVLQNDK